MNPVAMLCMYTVQDIDIYISCILQDFTLGLSKGDLATQILLFHLPPTKHESLAPQLKVPQFYELDFIVTTMSF